MRRFLAACACCALSACSAPTVNLSTPEPIKVDISMRLDVYQHTKETATKAPATSPGISGDPAARRRNRMADVQTFKNQQLVGEGHDGLLAIRSEPSGEEGDFLRKTVAAENADRREIMAAQAEKEKKSLSAVEAEQAALWRQRSFEGELIEVPKPDGGFEWTAKSGR